MDAYRKARPPLSLAPPAPRWRLLGAWQRGTLKRLHAARLRRGWAVYWRRLDSYDREDGERRITYWADVAAAHAALWAIQGITVAALQASLERVRRSPR